MLSIQGFGVHRQTDEKIARIEQIHAALRESIAAIKLLADDADGMLEKGRELSPEPPRAEPRPRLSG